ncbi:hypothetical protein CQ012_01960 [Arthrobacter sp. MYb214]|nr:hypothetical protein CQ012_01960 [Arthrobacter sp. MYb214]
MRKAADRMPKQANNGAHGAKHQGGPWMEAISIGAGIHGLRTGASPAERLAREIQSAGQAAG